MGGRNAVTWITTAFVAVLSLAICTGASAAESCSNERHREEQNSTYLPDCRAYEMVSPLEKNGTNVEGDTLLTQSTPDGERVVYSALAGFGEVEGSGGGGFTQYLASRQPEGGWTSHGITPTPGRDAFQFITGATILEAYSEDLNYVAVEAYTLRDAAGAAESAYNNYRLDTATGAVQTLTAPVGEVSLAPFDLYNSLRGSSGDMGVITFEASINFLPQAEGSGPKLYAWDHGELKLVGILPDGSPASDSSAAIEEFSYHIPRTDRTTVSRDGSRIVFISPGEGGQEQLYLRRNGASTAWVSESEGSAPVSEPSEVEFQWMSRDGNTILFTTADRLTDSDPGGAPLGLYMYKDGPSPTSESNLTFIARVKPFQLPKTSVDAVSEDGSRIYFYTEATPEFPEAGMYLWDNGTIHFVAPMQENPAYRQSEPARASQDGRVLAFTAEEQLTSAPVGRGVKEMYVYDEEGESLRCVSCRPDGMLTTSSVEVEPKATTAGAHLYSLGNERFVSADGSRVFFTTPESLVPGDVNGRPDAYEYDVQSGQLSLLSPGTDEQGAWFVAANENGDDAFIVTADELVGFDTDTLVDLYDVRVGGGVPEPTPQTGGCVGDECQGTPSAAPSFDTASGFTGLGNVVAPTSGGKSKPKALTRAQKLARALKACGRRHKARMRCKTRARTLYRVKKIGKRTSNGARR
ncbi:MAG TPA: hypothetical protein VGF95_01735 [Solirubrobacteraceae bacterium]|jgi:Tol biopolymer transport system component